MSVIEHMYDHIMTLRQVFDEGVATSPDGLVSAFVEHERQAAQLALAVARVEASGAWALDGSLSMRSWMRRHLRMSDADVTAWLRRAGVLASFPAVAEAAVSHTVSASQVGELERCTRPKHRPLFAELQHELVALVAPLDAEQTGVACAAWRQHADAIVAEHEPPLPPVRSLTLADAGDGAVVGRLELDAAAALELRTALTNAHTFTGPDDTRTRAERQGDALFDIAAFYNRHHHQAVTPRHHPHVTLSLHADTLDRPVSVDAHHGGFVAAHLAETALCDCLLHTVLRDPHGTPVGFGRTRYAVPRALFRQVAERDGGCRHPGCNRPVSHCEAHHVRHWQHGGPTEYANLVLLCARHHHLVHQQGSTLTLHDDGRLVVSQPSGHTAASRPRGTPPRASTISHAA